MWKKLIFNTGVVKAKFATIATETLKTLRQKKKHNLPDFPFRG
jgi:hypothetical protein